MKFKIGNRFQALKVSLIVISIFFTVSSIAQKKPNMQGIEIGMKAPEINLNRLNGDSFNLDQLSGKIVFVNFWASWCGPCRKKNPELIEIQNQFKNEDFDNGEKGFDMVYVSLDKNKQAWENSVKKDSLGMMIHVGDIQGWHSAAAQAYNISRIPSSVLLDGDGKIIATNLSPKELKKILNRKKKKYFFWF